MKKLALSALFVVLLFGSAFAHDGALSLYKDQTIQVCSDAIGAFETDTIRMYYVRDNGSDLGNAVEFMLVISDPEALFLGLEWNSQINVTTGDVLTGISATAGQCLGANEPVVYIAAFYIMNTNFMGGQTFTVSVAADPGAQPPGIYITECVPGNPIKAVLGGTFVFNGSCNPGVTETSWGAIKELYR
jgi:hypothetical protein